MNEKWIFVFNKTKREKLRVTLQVIFLLQCIQQSATQIQLKGKTTDPFYKISMYAGWKIYLYSSF